VTFRPKYVPFDEAKRQVAERLGLPPKAYNPIIAALGEGALLPEVRRKGAWIKLKAGDWDEMSIWYPSPYVFPSDPPEDWQTRHTDIRIECATLDEFWPDSSRSELPKTKGGRPPAADWAAIEEALEREIDAVGLPDKSAEPGWRNNADVVRWIEPLLGDAEPGRTALKQNTTDMLNRIRAKKVGN
jgi:hypothetical protein